MLKALLEFLTDRKGKKSTWLKKSGYREPQQNIKRGSRTPQKKGRKTWRGQRV